MGTRLKTFKVLGLCEQYSVEVAVAFLTIGVQGLSHCVPCTLICGVQIRSCRSLLCVPANNCMVEVLSVTRKIRVVLRPVREIRPDCRPGELE